MAVLQFPLAKMHTAPSQSRANDSNSQDVCGQSKSRGVRQWVILPRPELRDMLRVKLWLRIQCALSHTDGLSISEQSHATRRHCIMAQLFIFPAMGTELTHSLIICASPWLIAFLLSFYNSLSHTATTETDCSCLCRVTMWETSPPFLLSMFIHWSFTVLPPSGFKIKL